ncbi:MAG: hypothetical protein V1875_02885 [Candidatus Altiarchaeota archaeon]
MEKPTHVKLMGALVFLIVLVLSVIIIVAVFTKYGDSETFRMDWWFSPGPQVTTTSVTVSTTTTTQPASTTSSTSTTTSSTSSTLHSGNRSLRIPDLPKPELIGDLDNNLGRIFVNKSIVFNETGGLSRISGTVRQLVEIDEADIGKYDGDEIYLQYWNGTWVRL